MLVLCEPAYLSLELIVLWTPIKKNYYKMTTVWKEQEKENEEQEQGLIKPAGTVQFDIMTEIMLNIFGSTISVIALKCEESLAFLALN